jgi:ankyrin repeat protein
MDGLIFRAAEEGNEQEVLRLLDAHPALVETADADGMTVLALAAEHNQLGMVKLLVRRGANINATGAMDMTALHFAAQAGYEEIVAFLLDEGAQLNITDTWGMTPLILASMSGHLGVVRRLAQHMGTQELDESDEDGRTALHWAIANGHEEMVAFLLSKGAQASTWDHDVGETPFIRASMHGQIGVVRLLFEDLGTQALTDVDCDGWTALHNAAFYGRDEVLRFLLLAGSDHTITGIVGDTPRACAEEEHEQLDDESIEGKIRCLAVLEVSQTTCCAPRTKYTYIHVFIFIYICQYKYIDINRHRAYISVDIENIPYIYKYSIYIHI